MANYTDNMNNSESKSYTDMNNAKSSAKSTTSKNSAKSKSSAKSSKERKERVRGLQLLSPTTKQSNRPALLRRSGRFYAGPKSETPGEENFSPGVSSVLSLLQKEIRIPLQQIIRSFPLIHSPDLRKKRPDL